MRTILISAIILSVLLSCKQQKREEHQTHTPVQASTISNDLMLSESQIRLANITTQRVTRKPVGETTVISGSLTVNKQRSMVISSRAAGRIEKLFVKETGRPIRKGEPLYQLYSESLLTLQQEYLLAKDQYQALGKTEKRYKSFLDAAEKKLLLYGLTDHQIGQLNRDSMRPYVTFNSPSTGIVTEIQAAEGQYIEEGTALYNMEDVTSLWVEAELYPNEASVVKFGDKIKVTLSGFESSPLETTVNYISPEYRANTQILVMRAEIKNPALQFKPGQQVQIFLTRSSHDAIAIPTDAVIRDSKGAHVYVQEGNAIFRPRMVKTGTESFEQVEITEGLNEGDTVAVTGAYLLYSEMVLRRGGIGL